MRDGKRVDERRLGDSRQGVDFFIQVRFFFMDYLVERGIFFCCIWGMVLVFIFKFLFYMSFFISRVVIELSSMQFLQFVFWQLVFAIGVCFFFKFVSFLRVRVILFRVWLVFCRCDLVLGGFWMLLLGVVWRVILVFFVILGFRY